MMISLRKAIASIVSLSAVFTLSCPAAVLLTTGKDSTGRAYVEFATPLTFQITTTATVTDFGIIIKNAFPTTPPSVSYGVDGSGVRGTLPGSPTAFINYWTSGVTKSDAALASVAGTFTTLNFVAGQTFTLQSGRFTTTNPVSGSFPIFATGYYDLYLQNAYSPGQILSANAVPEPSVTALLAAGVAAIAARRRLP